MTTSSTSAIGAAQSQATSITQPSTTPGSHPPSLSPLSALSAPSVSDSARHEELPQIVDNGTDNNFGEWQMKASIMFQTWDLWKYIEGPDSEPPAIPPYRETKTVTGPDKDDNITTIYFKGNEVEHRQKVEESKPWTTGNALALSKILKATPIRQLRYIKGIQYAKQAWEILREIYLSHNAIRTSSIHNDIVSNRCTPDMDVAMWLNEMQQLYDVLSAMDETNLTDRNFTLTIINNMPKTESWRVIVAGYRNTIAQYDKDGIPVKSSEFITKIRDENWFHNKDNPQSSTYVFATRASAEKKAQKRPRPPDAATTAGPSKRTRGINDKTCTNCSRKGHDVSECITYGGGNAGNYPQWWKGPWNLHLPPEKRSRDNNIPPSTHPAFAKYAATAKSATCLPDSHTPSPTRIDNDQDDAPAALKAETPSDAWIALLEESAFVVSLPVLGESAPKNDACHYDSGANRHVFHDHTAFEKYEIINPLTVRGFGGHYTAAAIGRGTVRLEGRYYGKKSTIVLTEVLHIPVAHSNLVSGLALNDAGIAGKLDKRTVILSRNGVAIVGGIVRNNMFQLDANIIRPTTPVPLSHNPCLNDPISKLVPTAAIADSRRQDFSIA
jgi:hypothetical protein